MFHFEDRSEIVFKIKCFEMKNVSFTTSSLFDTIIRLEAVIVHHSYFAHSLRSLSPSKELEAII